MPDPVVPRPLPFIPDVRSFLTAIGRGLSQHAGKFPSWAHLFSASSQQMREWGVEPARNRRYLLHWREKFRNGEYGIGGDLTEVQDGVAEVRIVEVPTTGAAGQTATATQTPGTRKVIANVPVGSRLTRLETDDVRTPAFLQLRGANVICGPHVHPVHGTNGMSARIVLAEGIWEERRGHKVDGGERRKAEVRAKRRAAERKAAGP